MAAFDENALIDALDDSWRSPAQVATRLGSRICSVGLASALERLAETDKIDRRSQATPVRKRNGDHVTIKYYRRFPGRR